MRLMKVTRKRLYFRGGFFVCCQGTKRNKKMALYCHRKTNSIMFVCGYVGPYHACDHVIKRTIAICPCPDNCKVCKEEIDKREYYDCRWQKNEDG